MSYTPTQYYSEEEMELIRPLASELLPRFDSTRDALIDSALSALNISEDTLKRDYAYQYVDFRDKRKLESALTTGDRVLGFGQTTGKWEMTRGQMEHLKSYRKRIKEASKMADSSTRSDHQTEPLPRMYQPLFESPYMTSTAREVFKLSPLPSLDVFVSRIVPVPSPEMLSLVDIDKDRYCSSLNTKELLSAKLVKTRAEMDLIRRYRKKLMKATKEPILDETTLIEEFRQEIESNLEYLNEQFAAERSPSPDPFPTPPAELPPSPRGIIIRSQCEEPQDLNLGSDTEMKYSQKEDERKTGSMEEAKNLPKSSTLLTNEPSSSPRESTKETSSDLCNLGRPQDLGSPSVSNSRIVSNTRFDGYRLNSNRANSMSLSSFGTEGLDGMSSFIPTAGTKVAKSPPQSLEWNPLVGAPETLSDLSLALDPDEQEKLQGPRRAARTLRDKLIDQTREADEDSWNGLEKGLNEAWFEKLEFGEEDEKEEESQDPFVFFKGLRAHPSLPTLPSRKDSTSIVEVPRTPSPFLADSSSRPRPSLPFSTFPPPYTLYKRRAISLPPPPLSPIHTSYVSRFTEMSGHRMEPDEFGFVEAELTTSGPSSPSTIRNSSDTEEEKRPGQKRRLEEATEGSDVNGQREEVTKPIKEVGQRGGNEVVEIASQSKPETEHGRKASTTRSSATRSPVPRSSTTFRLSDSMERFMASRGRHLPTGPPVASRFPTELPVSALKTVPTVSDPRSPPTSLPFPVASFLSASPSTSNNTRLRVVIFDSVLQRRPLFSALQNSDFELVHRPSRYPSSRSLVRDPHLITSGTSCVFYFKSIDLIGNAVREDSPSEVVPTRQESIFATLRRFSSLYDHILVIFEEQQASNRSSSVKPYSFTPPVLEGLSRLARAVDTLSKEAGGTRTIQIACSRGPDHSVDMTRKYADFVQREDEKEARSGIDGWGERLWLRDDPQPEESSLLESSSLLNEMTVCAILSITTPEDFLKMTRDDLSVSFASVCGFERISRIAESLHARQHSVFTSPTYHATHISPSLANLVAIDISPRRVDSLAAPESLNFEDVFDVDRYEEDV